jgi:hypothetical protein
MPIEDSKQGVSIAAILAIYMSVFHGVSPTLHLRSDVPQAIIFAFIGCFLVVTLRFAVTFFDHRVIYYINYLLL